VKLAKQLEDQAQKRFAGYSYAIDHDDLKEKSKKMFGTCKSCHDQFRKPEEKKKK
jgi:cytochrome c556